VKLSIEIKNFIILKNLWFSLKISIYSKVAKKLGQFRAMEKGQEDEIKDKPKIVNDNANNAVAKKPTRLRKYANDEERKKADRDRHRERYSKNRKEISQRNIKYYRKDMENHEYKYYSKYSTKPLEPQATQ